MKYITHNEEQISNIYSSEKGKLNTTYNKLIEIFGLPRNIYSGKIDVKWQIMFENGTYVEIYNWKNGINYVKNFDIKNNTDWTIGGNHQDSVDLINGILSIK